METILQVRSHSKNNESYQQEWYYTINNELYCLQYIFQYLTVKTTDKSTSQKYMKVFKKETFNVRNVKSKSFENVCDIEGWLVDNFQYIELAQQNLDLVERIEKYLNEQLGCNTMGETALDIGWTVKNYFQISIKKYETLKNVPDIRLTHKGKETILTEARLKKFLETNKATITKAQSVLQKQYNNKMLELTMKLEQSKESDKPIVPEPRAPKQMNASLMIKRTLKELYETVACKPYPEAYPWNNSKIRVKGESRPTTNA